MIKLAAACALVLSFARVHAQHSPQYDPTPRIGILVPKGPPDYKLLLDALQTPHHVHDGAFDFETGTISGTPVVLIIQPAPGEVLRALGATSMIHDFNVRLLLYPGTSGGHLPKGQMSAGDIVLGAKNVNHGNYYLAPDGHMEASEFNAAMPNQPFTGPFYADPALLALLACSASHVAAAVTLPRWIVPIRADAHPQIFYFGIQGTSEVWSDNETYTKSEMAVFQDIDEDGDWYSNLAASLFNIPFLEVSVISNSIFAYPGAPHGTPPGPASEPNSHVLAQRLSNRILLDLITHSSKQLLSRRTSNPAQTSLPASYFETPLNPRTLLDGCKE